MEAKINKILSLNMLSTFIVQGVNFITIPLFSRLLGTTQYGIYSLFASWVSIFTCAIGFSMVSAIGPGMYTFKNEYREFRNSILCCTTLISIVQVVFVVLFRNFIGAIIDLPPVIVCLIILSSLGHYLMMFVQNVLTYEKRALENLILSVGYSILSVLASLILIFLSDRNERYIGRIHAVTLSYLFFGILFSTFLIKEKPMGINKKYCSFGFKVSYPIIFHSLALNILIQSDRVMMNYYRIEPTIIGIYSLFYSFCSILSVIVTALNNSWTPFYFDYIDEKKWSVLKEKSRNYIHFFSIICFGFIMLSREVSYIIGDSSYRGGINIIPVLALGIYFTFIYQFIINYEFFYKKTKIISFGTVFASVLNVILNAILIPLWGMYGAAIATALSYFTLFLTHYIIITHMKEYRYHLKWKVFIPGIIGMLVGTILFYALSSWWYIRWGLGIALGCLELYRIYKRKSIF